MRCMKMKENKEELEKHVQMHMKMNFTAFIVWLLSKKSMHGYAIIKKLEEEHPNICAANRLYPLLNELEKKGYISKKHEREGKREKLVYTTTKKGLELLKKFKKEMDRHKIIKAFVSEMME